MPKEVIKTRNKETITIGWERDSVAQVGVTLGSHFVFTDKNGNPLLKEDGQETYTALFATLEFTDRQEFNDLIRALRKARDAVCGKDE